MAVSWTSLATEDQAFTRIHHEHGTIIGVSQQGEHPATRRSHPQVEAGHQGRPVGVNIAKTHDPNILGAAAVEDFATSFRLLAPLADFVVLNVSCPNTTEGKTFEERDIWRIIPESSKWAYNLLKHGITWAKNPPSGMILQVDLGAGCEVGYGLLGKVLVCWWLNIRRFGGAKSDCGGSNSKPSLLMSRV